MSYESEYMIRSRGEYKELDALEKNRIKLSNIKENNFAIKKKYENFTENTKDYLVSEAIYFVVNSALQECNLNDLNSLCKNLVYEFVKEESSNRLLVNFETKSTFLSEMSILINESYDAILEKVDKEDENTFNIKEKDNNNFFNSLKKKDISHITKEIKNRVEKSTEEFIQNNVNDKLDIEDSAKKIKEKIDNVKSSDKNAEEIKNEFAILHRKNINSIRNRKKNVLEQIINNIFGSILLNEDSSILESYKEKSGKISMDKIIEESTLLYTFLESINTCRIKEVDKEYLSDIINSIK